MSNIIVDVSKNDVFVEVSKKTEEGHIIRVELFRRHVNFNNNDMSDWTVNWGALGSVAVSMAKEFREVLSKAIEVAEKLNNKE